MGMAVFMAFTIEMAIRERESLDTSARTFGRQWGHAVWWWQVDAFLRAAAGPGFGQAEGAPSTAPMGPEDYCRRPYWHAPVETGRVSVSGNLEPAWSQRACRREAEVDNEVRPGLNKRERSGTGCGPKISGRRVQWTPKNCRCRVGLKCSVAGSPKLSFGAEWIEPRRMSVQNLISGALGDSKASSVLDATAKPQISFLILNAGNPISVQGSFLPHQNAANKMRTRPTLPRLPACFEPFVGAYRIAFVIYTTSFPNLGFWVHSSQYNDLKLWYLTCLISFQTNHPSSHIPTQPLPGTDSPPSGALIAVVRARPRCALSPCPRISTRLLTCTGPGSPQAPRPRAAGHASALLCLQTACERGRGNRARGGSWPFMMWVWADEMIQARLPSSPWSCQIEGLQACHRIGLVCPPYRAVYPSLSSPLPTPANPQTSEVKDIMVKSSKMTHCAFGPRRKA